VGKGDGFCGVEEGIGRKIGIGDKGWKEEIGAITLSNPSDDKAGVWKNFDKGGRKRRRPGHDFRWHLQEMQTKWGTRGLDRQTEL